MQNAKKRKRKTQTQNVHKCIYVSIHKTRLKRNSASKATKRKRN